MKQKKNLREKTTNRFASIVMSATLMGFSPSIHVDNINGQTQLTMQIMNSVYAAEKGTFQPPSLKGYKFNTKWNIDWDEDGRVDTTIKNYKHKSKDSISKLYKKGTNKIWAWSLNTANDDNSDITKNYTLVDTDNDGKFDTIYNIIEDLPLPGWVEQ